MADFNDILNEMQNNNISFNNTLEEMKQYGIMDTNRKKSLNLSMTLEEKQKYLQENLLKKELNIEGYKQGSIKIKDLLDMDSPLTVDNEGTSFTTRATTDFAPFLDGIETSKEKILSNPNKMKTQPRFLEEVLGKPFSDITDAEIRNVANWQLVEGLINPAKATEKTGNIRPYDMDTDYSQFINLDEEIPVIYKSKGKDYYGKRELVSYINPNTGEELTHTMGTNPYLNTNLDIFSVIDSIPNRQRLLKDNNARIEKLRRNLEESLDPDNRVLENIDLIQSSFLQSGANILTLFNREFLGKPIDALDRVLADNGLPTVAELTNPETGKIVADSITGVKTSTREAYNKGMSEALNEWKEGNYLNSLYKAVGQVDRILAESSPQMVAMSASAALKGVPAIGMLLLAATDQTARNAIEYKHNNNGAEWSAEQYALDFALNAALLVPERVLIVSGFDKLLKPSLNRIFKNIPDDLNVFSAVKAMATSVGGEALQEYAQGVEQAYMTQNQVNKQSLLDIATESEQVFSGAVGGLVAGTITSVPVSVTSTVNGLIGHKNKKITEKENTRKSEVTVTNTDADKDLSATTIDKVNNIQVANYDPSTLTEVYKVLDKMSASSELSEAAIETIAKKKVEIETTGILMSNEVANSIKNKEETLERIIYYSDPDTEAKREDLDAIGEKLGFSKDKVRQKIKESKDTHRVEYEAKYGSIGYITIRDVISGIDSAIAEDSTTLSENEKTSLLEKKDKLVAGLKGRYFNSQISKLNTIAEAIPDLRLQRKVYYGDGNYIAINDVLNNDIGSGAGIYATIDGAIRNIEGINQTLKSLGLEENSLDNFNKVITKLKNNINSLRVESITPVKDVVSDTKAVFRGVTKAVKTSLEEGNDTALRKAFRTYGIEGLKATSTRLKEIDATKYKNLINKLDDAISKVETTIKNKNSNAVSPSTERSAENMASTEEIETKVESLPSKDTTSSEKPKSGSTKKSTAKSTKTASVIIRIKELGGIDPKSIIAAGYNIKEFKEDYNFSILNSKSKNSVDEIVQILMEEGTVPINDSSVDAIDHFLKFLKQNTELRKDKSIEEKEEEYYRNLEEKENIEEFNDDIDASTNTKESETIPASSTETKSKLDKVKDYIKTFKDVVSPLFTNMDESPINEKLEKISELQRNIDTLQDTRKELQDNILSTRESIDSINVFIQTAKTKEERRIYLEAKKEANDLLKTLYKEQRKLYLNKVRKLELNIQNIYKQIPNTAIVQRLEQIPLGDIVEATKVPNTVFGFSTIDPKFILPNGIKVFDIVKDIYNAIDSSRFDVKKESPALQLLFTDNINPNKNNKVGDHIPNTNLAVAIDYSVKEFMLHNLNMLNPFTDDDIKRAFGLDEFKPLPTEYRTLAYEGGTYRVIIADMLGQAIADNLGIKPKSTTSQVDYKTFISNLGSYALVYAEYKGLIETSRWVGNFNENKNKSTFRRFGDNEKSTSTLRPFHMVKAKVTSEQLDQIKAEYEALAPYRISNNFDRMPLPNPKYRETTEISDKYLKREANVSVHEAITKLEKIPHVLNYELIKYIEDNIEVVKSYLGYTEDTEVSYYTSESQKAINKQILQHLDSIIDLSKKDHSEWFLPYIFTVNGRYMVDTTAVNPMQDSDIARWLFVPKGREVTISLDNEQDMLNFRYAIAQAFGYAVDKRYTTSREEFAEKILSLDAVTLKSEILKYKDKKSLETNLGFGFEHFGQLLVGIQALEAYQTAKNLGNKSFNVSLSAEFDSTTSAYFIKQLLFPTSNLAKYNEKVGIFDGVEKDFHNVKAKKAEYGKDNKIIEEGFFDIYQTSAKALKLINKTALEKKLKSRNSKKDLLSQDKKFTLAVYSLLYDTLPKVAEDSTEVSTELRTLIKDPNMVFGYGAGRQALAYSLGFKLTTSLVDNYIGGKADKAEQRVFEGIRSKLVVPMNKKEFITALKESPLDSIKIKLGDTTTSVEQFLVTLLSDTYGDSVYDTLSQEFKDYVDIGFFMNSAFSIMFDNWKVKFDSAVEKIESKLKRKLSIEEENRIVAKSLEFLPIIPSPYSDILEEGIAILDSKRVVSKDAPNNKVHPKGKSSISLKARIFELAAAVSSGAVLPIHWVDGAMMTHMINSFNDLQGIHDAIIPTLKDLHKASKEYNKQAYLIGKNYNLLEHIVDRLDYLFKDADLNMLLPNIHNKNNIIPDVEHITLGDFMNAIKDMSAKINIARDAFYSNPNIVISNMSGIEGSYFKASELENELDTAIKDNTRYGSDPYSYTTDTEYITLTEASLTDTKVRLEILERLNSMEAIENNEEYMNYLKSLLGSVDSRHLNDITIGINKYTARNSGYFDTKDKEINLDVVTDKRIPISYMDKSAVEIYAHEVIHAIIDPALSNPKVYGTAKTIRQLLNLQRLAMDHITVEDLIPKGYENDKASINRAKDLWDYMFNNEDTANLRGLKEFIIHGLTNKVVMNKLKDVVVIEEKTETKFIDKLVSLFKGLVSLLTGKESFSKAFPRIASAMIGEIPVTSTDRNVLEGLRRMLDDLATADAKAVGKLTYPFKPVEKLFQSTGELINKGNKLISPYLHDLITLADKIGYKTPVKEIAETKLDQVKWLAKVIPALLFSERAREAVPIILKILGFKHTDLVQTVIRDMSEPDLDSQALEALGLLSRKVEQVASEIKSTVHTELLNSYGDKLNELQKESITKVGLYTDLSVLLDDMDYNEIKTLLVDEEALKTKIQALESTLPERHKNWYTGQAKMLAHYMLTGEGNEALLLNAYSIASGIGLKKRIQAKDSTVKNIDILTTLYALNMSSKASKNTFASLSDNGNISLLKAHKAFVKESKNLVLDSPYHTVKGYTKQLLDNSIEVQVAPEEQSAYMKQNGFEFVHKLADNKLTGKKGIALYKRLYNTNRARNGATFMLAGQHNIGTELSNIVKEDMIIRDEKATNLTIHKHMLKADGIKDMINSELEKGNHDITKLLKIGARFVPLLNSRGEIVNYRITMDNETKEKILGQNVDGLEILSRMYSSNVLKISSVEQNKKILEFLIKDMDKNFVAENLLGINKKQYVQLTPESSDPFVQKAVQMLPQMVRDYIFAKKELYVREDWLLSLFGESDMSIIDTKVLAKSSPMIKRGIQLAEEILKSIASIAKINIVIRTPKVFLGNIISNFNYSVMTGNNPLVVLKMQLENAQNIRDYINNRKALSKIQFRQKTGIATDNEVKRINWYKTRLEQNPVHPLMEKGMYQAIIEDLDPDDIGTTNKIYKYMNKKFNKVPEGIKTTAKHLYLAEGTPFFQLMLMATQYSDFVARATEYQLLMAKAPKEAEKVADYEKLVSYKVLNAFINYDKPSSAVEQYLNDMGLLMFTKFAKRIQSVIKRTSLDNPLSTALFLASQFTFVDSDDILEQNLLNKNFEVLYHSFYDNLVSTVVPSSVRLLTD